MRSIKQILMDRDDMTAEDAQNLIDETKDEIMDAISQGDFFAPDEIMASNLGLEPDYIDQLIPFAAF